MLSVLIVGFSYSQENSNNSSGSSFFSFGFFVLFVDRLFVAALLSPLVDSSELSVDNGSSGGLGDTVNIKAYCSRRSGVGLGLYVGAVHGQWQGCGRAVAGP